jgi:hypothetical protein
MVEIFFHIYLYKLKSLGTLGYMALMKRLLSNPQSVTPSQSKKSILEKVVFRLGKKGERAPFSLSLLGTRHPLSVQRQVQSAPSWRPASRSGPHE